jgi:hypothetical protein
MTPGAMHKLMDELPGVLAQEHVEVIENYLAEQEHTEVADRSA